ncbi:hypothetical protein SRIMM317S_07333 [Streptomyces rimosus subsp. rimosus]
MNNEKAESPASSVLALAEEVLLEEFQQQVVADPQSALETVDRLVMGMHSASCGATGTARKAGVSWHEIGRAHAALEGAGILLRQAAALFLALPAADRVAEREMLATPSVSSLTKTMTRLAAAKMQAAYMQSRTTGRRPWSGFGAIPEPHYRRFGRPALPQNVGWCKPFLATLGTLTAFALSPPSSAYCSFLEVLDQLSAFAGNIGIPDVPRRR